MTGTSWLVDGNRFASKIKSASGFLDKEIWKSNPSKLCPSCSYIIDNSDVVQEWPGLPLGVKFDPSDAELLWHLLAKQGKEGASAHPFIDEFIPTVKEEEGICYTHPEKLPGVRQDGSISHFFHRTSKAYSTGVRKRRKIKMTEPANVSWHKTGTTKPVIIDGRQLGRKKIMVLYTNTEGRKPEKSNWVMHQYHVGAEDIEIDGDYVVSKIFFQLKPEEKNGKGRTTSDTTNAEENTDHEAVKEKPNDNCHNADHEVFHANEPNDKENECLVDKDNTSAEDPNFSQILMCSEQLADGLKLCEEFLQSSNPALLGSEHEPSSLGAYAAPPIQDFEKPNENCDNADHEVFHANEPTVKENESLVDKDNASADVPNLSQILMCSEQLADGLKLCEEFLPSSNSTLLGGQHEPSSLGAYATLPIQDFENDLEDCWKLGAKSSAELGDTTEFRLSQLDFLSEPSLATYADPPIEGMKKFQENLNSSPCEDLEIDAGDSDEFHLSQIKFSQDVIGSAASPWAGGVRSSPRPLTDGYQGIEPSPSGGRVSSFRPCVATDPRTQLRR